MTDLVQIDFVERTAAEEDDAHAVVAVLTVLQGQVGGLDRRQEVARSLEIEVLTNLKYRKSGTKLDLKLLRSIIYPSNRIARNI